MVYSHEVWCSGADRDENLLEQHLGGPDVRRVISWDKESGLIDVSKDTLLK